MDIKAQASFLSGNVNDHQCQPFVYPQEGGTHKYDEMVPFHESGSGSNLLAGGLWRCNNLGESPIYSSELGDEKFLVLAGEVDIKVVETAEVFEYRVDDPGRWSRGTKTVWNVISPFRKFYVVAQP
ncbi:MAG: hypothetical protein ACU84Q_08130 [Gammaproteobacteria bacterium]